MSGTGIILNQFQVGNIFRCFVKTDFDKHPLKACQAGTPDVLCGRSPLDLARIDKWLISRFAASFGLFWFEMAFTPHNPQSGEPPGSTWNIDHIISPVQWKGEFCMNWWVQQLWSCFNVLIAVSRLKRTKSSQKTQLQNFGRMRSTLFDFFILLLSFSCTLASCSLSSWTFPLCDWHSSPACVRILTPIITHTWILPSITTNTWKMTSRAWRVAPN